LITVSQADITENETGESSCLDRKENAMMNDLSLVYDRVFGHTVIYHMTWWSLSMANETLLIKKVHFVMCTPEFNRTVTLCYVVLL